ncbi:MAG: Asp-tRNA(Asn)/Glu-tRNA(Gln) amidotransferase subunit GatA [Lachnospiraceae bacterium]|nr:Asp-tRNA(Asn)/Glu-tRNA(Gln) amidotransferase subunit GatA [Lachnospiraceae bacterium]
MQLTQLTAVELGTKIKSGEIGAVEAARASLEQIGRLDSRVQAYLAVEPDKVLLQAAEVERGIRSGKYTGVLAGVPIAIKDNICTKDIKTTCASRILENFVPFYDAEAVTRIKDAGLVILGKTNMDEFAMGSTTETSAFQSTKNPWELSHVPGGSSGGSCAAVAAGECFAALGSDTGGSIRQPSAYCGVTGIKPTYGTVSRYGLIAYASSLDQIGPIAKDGRDCAALLEVIAGQDPKDCTSMARPDTGFLQAVGQDIKGMRVGIPTEYLSEGLDGEVRSAVMLAAGYLKEAGAVVEEFKLGLMEYTIPAYYVIASAEASSNLERFDGVKYGYRAKEYEGLHDMYKRSRSEGFGPEVKRRIMLGSFVLSAGYYDAYYLKALRARACIKHAFDEAFSGYDILLGPAAPTAAPKLGTSLTDPMKMYLSDIYTVAVNLAGLPGLTVPCMVNEAGLPIGVQLIGDCFAEKKLFAAGAGLEAVRGPWRLPDFAGEEGHT